jgi:F-type H+-transporting ATPase subunit b
MISFSLSTFLVTIVNIGVLFFVLRAVLFKPVTKFMEDRSAKIRDAIDQAEKDKNQAKAMLAQYETQLRAAGDEAAAIVRQAREGAQAEADRIIAEGKVSAETILANARRQIETEQRAAVAEFRREAAVLVTAASARLVGRELNAEDNRQYADMLISEIEIGKN